MATRSFRPLLTRRAGPAPKPAKRPAVQTRTSGAPTGLPRFAAVARKAPAISQRNDRWEGEARRVAETAQKSSVQTPAAAAPSSTKAPAPIARASPTRAHAPAAASRATPPALRAGPREHRIPSTGPPILAPPSPASFVPTGALPEVGSTGQSLNPSLCHKLESVLGADLNSVRVHTAPKAQYAAQSVGARAFTVGSNIYLGAGESASDVSLIAHETAHVIQQSATLSAAHPRGPPAPSHALSLSAAPSGMIQRLEMPGWMKDAGNAVVDTVGGAVDLAGDAVSAVGDIIAEGFWAVVDRIAPAPIASLLHEINDVGFLGVLKKKLSSAIDFVFSALKAQGGTTAKIATVFETLLAKAKPILAALAAGNCEPLFKAVKELGATLGKMAGDAWDKITTFLKPVGDWLTKVWTNFGAPVVDFLKEFASDTWDWIKNIGTTLWDGTRTVRDLFSGAWTEIKNLLGFGEGGDEDGGGGLIGWVKTQAGEVWDGIKTELKPVIDPIKNAASAISDFLPLKAILNLRERINEWIDKATSMADNMDQPDDVAENQDLLRDIIIPGIRRAITSLRGRVTEASTWATEAVGGLVGKVTSFFSGLAANTRLSPFSGAIQWLSDEAAELGTWATEKVAGLFGKVDQALATLDSWIDPVFKTLQKLANALSDLMGNLGDLVLGPLLLVPKCIRDPIKDFVVTRILSKIPIFAQLVELPAIWAKIQPAFRAVVVSIFRDGNLFRAAWIFFRTILDLLGIPPQLVTNLIRNAAKAFKDILNDPIGFLGNLLTAMKLGLLQFVDNIGKHLLKGAVDWLLSGVKGPGIKIADPFVINLKNVLDLVLQVLDLTMEKVFQRIEKLKGKEVADKVRKMAKVADKALEWISILINEGPSGLWKHLQKELSNLWDTMLNMVIDFLIGKIVQQATIWVTKTLASGGLSVIIDAIKAVYDALQVIAQYLKQMLEVANSVCEGVIDIAKGVLNKAADMVENAAARLIPMVLAFLARTLGIGDLPEVIGEGIQKVRTKVENAIDTLIEKTFAAIDWLKQKGKDAVNAALGWLGLREMFQNASGEKHQLFFRGKAEDAKLIVESTPRPLADFLTEFERAQKPTADEKAAITQIRARATEIEKIKSANSSRGRGSFSQADGELIQAKYKAILLLLSKLRGDGTAPPPTTIKARTTLGGSGDGTSVVVEPLSLNPGGLAGGQPYGESALWLAVSRRKRQLGGKTFYVRGHLLNHHIHGAGSIENMIPIHSTANAQMESYAESDVKNAVIGQNKVMRYEVHATGMGTHSGRTRIPQEAQMPTQITMSAYELEKNSSNAWVRKSGGVSFTPPPVNNVLPGDNEGYIEPAS